MSTAIARLGELPAGMLAGCERLVRADVTDPAARARQLRLIAVLLAAPFSLALCIALAVAPNAGMPIALAAICATIAIYWTLAVTVALTGRASHVEGAALALSACALAAVSHFGGLAAMALAAAVVVETFWIGRDRRSLVAGLGTAVAVLPLTDLVAIFLPQAANPPHLIAWLIPILYALVAAPRVSTFVMDMGPGTDRDAAKRPAQRWLELTTAGGIDRVGLEAAELLGLEDGELERENLADRVHLRDRLSLMAALADLREGIAAARTIDLRMSVPAAGEGRFMALRARLTLRGGGVVVAELEDRSEFVELQSELRRAVAKAEEVEIAKSRFLAAVSHELRTPLNSIIGFSDMMLHGIAGTGRQDEYLGIIRNSGNHLLSVVNAILDVSKIESGAYAIQPEPFHLRDALLLCHSMLAHQANAKGVTLELSARDDLGELVADRRAVQQIVINLLSNAIKFTPAGGVVRLEAVRLGSQMKLSVCDDGIGIAAEDIGRLCQPFSQVRNEMTRDHEGAGLGLSLVKGLVRLHEGAMAIESAPGDGTTVWVTLPVAGPRVAGEEFGEGGKRSAAGTWNEEASKETPRKRA